MKNHENPNIQYQQAYLGVNRENSALSQGTTYLEHRDKVVSSVNPDKSPAFSTDTSYVGNRLLSNYSSNNIKGNSSSNSSLLSGLYQTISRWMPTSITNFELSSAFDSNADEYWEKEGFTTSTGNQGSRIPFFSPDKAGNFEDVKKCLQDQPCDLVTLEKAYGYLVMEYDDSYRKLMASVGELNDDMDAVYQNRGKIVTCSRFNYFLNEYGVLRKLHSSNASCDGAQRVGDREVEERICLIAPKGPALKKDEPCRKNNKDLAGRNITNEVDATGKPGSVIAYMHPDGRYYVYENLETYQELTELGVCPKSDPEWEKVDMTKIADSKTMITKSNARNICYNLSTIKGLSQDSPINVLPNIVRLTNRVEMLNLYQQQILRRTIDLLSDKDREIDQAEQEADTSAKKQNDKMKEELIERIIELKKEKEALIKVKKDHEEWLLNKDNAWKNKLKEIGIFSAIGVIILFVLFIIFKLIAGIAGSTSLSGSSQINSGSSNGILSNGSGIEPNGSGFLRNSSILGPSKPSNNETGGIPIINNITAPSNNKNQNTFPSLLNPFSK